AAHLIDIVDDDPGMTEQACASMGQFDAAAAALEKRCAKGCFQALDAGTGRCQREMDPRRTLRDAAAVRHRDKQRKVNQIETHGGSRNHLPSSYPKAGFVSSRLCRSRGSVNVDPMFEPLLI